ncbi:MAG: ABC transporter ATP-binding protein/permease [Gammaproteobacteria bacterium]|nr:ABC transporter ATP-binding protein/permease [Gammaproteobacteria bacterium]
MKSAHPRKQLIDSPRGGLLRKSIHYFGHQLRPFWKLLLLGWFCMVAVALLQLIKPWPIKMVFDGLLVPVENFWIHDYAPRLADRPDLLLATIALSIFCIAALVALFGFGHSYIFKSVGQRVLAAIRRQFYAHVQRLPHSFHDINQSGDLLLRLTGDIRTLREILVSSIVFITERGLFMLGMLAVMLWMDWRLALVSILVLPPLALCSSFFAGRIRNANRLQRGREGKLASSINERIGAIRVVQAFARESFEDERYLVQEKANLEAGLRAAWLETHLARLAEVILASGTCAVLWYGVMRVQSGAITAGDLLVFVSYLKSMHKPVQKIAEITARFARVGACTERILSVLEVQSEVQDRPGAIEAPALQGRISFDSVSFAYGGSAPVLDRVSFEIGAGEHVAVVGVSGAGKSTLANLLLRFYDPLQGSVRIDGIDLRDYRLSSLRDQIAIVLQEAVLFQASVRDNIAYGRVDADEAAIRRAAAIADAQSFIEALEDGYDSLVGERGKALSGGQRQRIAIARAVVRDAPILLLDEPLSGLDIRSRTVVRAALARLQRGRSTLHITHDFESAATADRVLLLEHGRVAGFDHHLALLQGNSAYRKLWSLRDPEKSVVPLRDVAV